MPRKPTATTETAQGDVAEGDTVLLDRSQWELPDPDDPALAHITPDLRPLAIPVGLLTKLPGNYHQGDAGVVNASITKFTQRKPIVVNRTSGHIEAGNTTFEATASGGFEWVAGVLVEDDHITEKAYAIIDNRAQELGWNDPALLSQMLLDIREDDDALFAFTGYDGDDLDDLLREVGSLGDVLSPDDPDAWSKNRSGTDTSEFGTVRPGLNAGERREAYEAASVRSLVLSYDMGQYVWLTEHLAHLRREFGVDNNADAILELVSDRQQSDYPHTTVTTVVDREHDGSAASLED